MLKIVRRICCGLDLNKSFVAACIATTNDQGVTTYKSKRFLPSPAACAVWPSGWLTMAAGMSV